ncbi:hypothetical protein HYH03_013741 [Edaphochlamys debaryana]|uniref:Uncharacterized protein n=1 Tax=Edaphochlamys debaryana TaxID=47281 RepID=A0A836BSZ1_9CHLO|nr:hypothetical protein HYH03_013741 [Edaphochlamys debaryana]|eukprot:KAG2487602.1 hypothetical protein HYH03_013741 [Edaphochlamys debaryana]
MVAVAASAHKRTHSEAGFSLGRSRSMGQSAGDLPGTGLMPQCSPVHPQRLDNRLAENAPHPEQPEQVLPANPGAVDLNDPFNAGTRQWFEQLGQLRLELKETKNEREALRTQLWQADQHTLRQRLHIASLHNQRAHLVRDRKEKMEANVRQRNEFGARIQEYEDDNSELKCQLDEKRWLIEELNQKIGDLHQAVEEVQRTKEGVEEALDRTMTKPWAPFTRLAKDCVDFVLTAGTGPGNKEQIKSFVKYGSDEGGRDLSLYITTRLADGRAARVVCRGPTGVLSLVLSLEVSARRHWDWLGPCWTEQLEARILAGTALGVELDWHPAPRSSPSSSSSGVMAAAVEAAAVEAAVAAVEEVVGAEPAAPADPPALPAAIMAAFEDPGTPSSGMGMLTETDGTPSVQPSPSVVEVSDTTSSAVTHPSPSSVKPAGGQPFAGSPGEHW